MNDVSLEQMFWIVTCGCILYPVVKGILMPGDTSSWPTVSGESTILSDSSGKNNVPVKVKPEVEQSFWYKAYGMLQSGIPTSLEGRVDATCISEALDKVKTEKMKLWSVKSLSNIRIYKLNSNTGEIADTYEVAVNLDTDTSHTPANHVLALPAPGVRLDIDTFAMYKDAEWLKEADTPTNFSTIRLTATSEDVK